MILLGLFLYWLFRFFSFFNHLYCFCGRKPSCNSLCHYPKLCGRRVGSTSVSVSAFFAFPYTNAFSTDSFKTALRACVRLLQLRDYFDVTFSDSNTVARSQSLCWTDLLSSLSHYVVTNLVSSVVLWLFLQPSCLLLLLVAE